MTVLLKRRHSAGEIFAVALTVQHEAHFVPRRLKAEMPPELKEGGYIVFVQIILLHIDKYKR